MIYFICILAYLAMLAAIAVYQSRRVKNQADFAVAGRSLSSWVMVCTMLAVWIGTGSIVGNAEQTYDRGLAAMMLPIGTFFGMILLAMIARKARNVEASSVPEIIERRFGHLARNLAMVSLVIAYMVIVSYQFNAGGAVLEVIVGDAEPVQLAVGDRLDRGALTKGRLVFTPSTDWTGETRLQLRPSLSDSATSTAMTIKVASVGESAKEQDASQGGVETTEIQENSFGRLRFAADTLPEDEYVIESLPEHGSLERVDPILTAQTATLIAAVCITAFTMLAGLLSLAYMDIITGIIIAATMCIAFPTYLYQAGGWSGMEASFAAMGNRPHHMQLWGVYSATDLINFILPVFLLVLGDANQYQRIFASRNAKGAVSAVTMMVFVAYAIELLIIATAWVAASMTPDPENGKYILIYAAKHYLALPLGCLFMVTVVAIIVSTANSFLHVPATTVINDLYLTYIDPQASQKRIVFLSRAMVVVFGVIGYLVSLMFSESTGFFQKALYAFTIYGASITPSLVAAIVWKRATKPGAVASIVVGALVSLVWSQAAVIRESLPPAVSDLDAVLPAITASVACLVAVSLLTRNPSEQSQEKTNTQ
ncbi:MAG: sodium:solute symporter family protein [bacterium]